jgi:hypothetical protein
VNVVKKKNKYEHCRLLVLLDRERILLTVWYIVGRNMAPLVVLLAFCIIFLFEQIYHKNIHYT